MEARQVKCALCQKKVGIFGVECKCKLIFCSRHRLPEMHQCSFDFKSKGKDQLMKDLVKIQNNKITTI